MTDLSFRTYNDYSRNRLFVRDAPETEYNGEISKSVTVTEFSRFTIPPVDETMDFITDRIHRGYSQGTDKESDGMRSAIPSQMATDIAYRDHNTLSHLARHCEELSGTGFLEISSARVPLSLFMIKGSELIQHPELYEPFVNMEKGTKLWRLSVSLEGDGSLDYQNFKNTVNSNVPDTGGDYRPEEIREHVGIVYDGLDTPEKIRKLHHYSSGRNMVMSAFTVLSFTANCPESRFYYSG